MSIIQKVKAWFSKPFYDVEYQADSTTLKTSASNLASRYLESVDYEDKTAEEIYEQMYRDEPEVGGGIDRISTLVCQSYKGFCMSNEPTLEDLANIDEYLSDNPHEESTPEEQKVLKMATIIAKHIVIKDIIECYSELLLGFGNIFIQHDANYVDTILPNSNITLVDEDSQINTSTSETGFKAFIKRGTILIIDEGETNQEVIKDFTHIKYKTTPVHVKDNKGRDTYGVYSISPLQRAVLSVWRKRIIEAIDVMWRWKAVPREHHQLDSAAINISHFSGETIEDKFQKAQAYANAQLKNYADAYGDRNPDQAYISYKDVDIKAINSNHAQLGSEDSLNSCKDQIWTSLNVPKSIVSGEGATSYAAELIISNYVSNKVIQLSDKVKEPILANIRKRILAIDPNLPAARLDINFELVMASSKIELFHQFAIMVDSGLFTETELRELVEYLPLTSDQRGQLFTKDKATTDAETPMGSKPAADALKIDNQKLPEYPETPQSNDQHTRDAGEEIIFSQT